MTENKQFNLHTDLTNNCFIVGNDCKFGMFDKLEREQCLRVIDKLNEQEKRIQELEEENASMKGRILNAMVKSNQVKCNCTTCICEDYVYEELKNGDVE